MSTNVLHLIKGLGPGGAEQLLVNQARASQGGDLDFHVSYLVSWKNHLCAPLAEAGWVTSCLESDRAWDLRWIPRFRQLLLRERIDVVHGHSPLVSAFARLAICTLPKKHRPRSIYTEHNEWGRHRPWTRRLNRLTIGLEDHVIAVSDAVKRSMPASLDVEVLIHGIDIEAVAAQKVHRGAVRHELGIADDEIVIGIVANFRKEKACDVLPEAAAQVTAGNPKVWFVSVGQGPLEAEIRAHHERLGLGDQFLILGYRDDATRVMSAFDIFTLASRHEGLPVSLMDALALELPVVATTVGGIPDALDESNSILIEPGDVAALVAAHTEMAGRARLDAASSGSGAERFDAGAAAATLAEHYREFNES